jgi:hypothetical protein
MADFASNQRRHTNSTRLKYSLLAGLISLGTLAITGVQAQDYKDLAIGELSRNHRIEQDETKFFRLKVDGKEYDREKDLIVKVFSEGQYQGDPDVYISRVSESNVNLCECRAIKSQIGKPIVSGSVLHLEKIPAQSVGKNSIQMIYSTLV